MNNVSAVLEEQRKLKSVLMTKWQSSSLNPEFLNGFSKLENLVQQTLTELITAALESTQVRQPEPFLYRYFVWSSTFDTIFNTTSLCSITWTNISELMLLCIALLRVSFAKWQNWDESSHSFVYKCLIFNFPVCRVNSNTFFWRKMLQSVMRKLTQSSHSCRWLKLWTTRWRSCVYHCILSWWSSF